MSLAPRYPARSQSKALAFISLMVAAGLAGCSKPAPDGETAIAPKAGASAAASDSAPTRAQAAAGIAWQHAATDAEVDTAFATARRENKPLFLYWGADWCPPC